MPRRLPWASKAGSSRPGVKPQPRPARTSRGAADRGDDFSEGTFPGSGSGRKGKERAVDSDSDLSDLAAESSTPRTNLLGRGAHRIERAPSSSPPPIADAEELQTEPMRKGVSQFDLRDDEWMMVEDEFLETAKLFTRHLHIAEYERLKETIEAKKKEVEIARPVVPNAKLSADGFIRERAKAQEKKQRAAIRDVFAAQEDDDDFFTTRVRPDRPKFPHSTFDSDNSDDLDTMRPPRTHPHPHNSTSTPLQPPTIKPQPPTSSLPPSRKSPPRQTPTTKPRPRPPRPTPFDMLDAYTPKSPKPPTTPHLPRPSPTLTQPSPLTKPRTPARDDGATPTSNASYSARTTSKKDTATTTINDRLAKRKAERDEQAAHGRKQKKAVQLDDIPTFLF